MLKLGYDIDGWLVDGMLGRGTAATIYRLRNPDGRVAALKVAHTTDETLVRRILAEGAVLQEIRHPNVVRVERTLVVGDKPALWMEYIEGPTLAKWLDAYELPTVDEALDIFKGICRGVQVAHSRGLVHRDLNPNNILLAIAAHKRVVPKLVDFGLVRPVVRPEPSRTATGPLGTVAYMAPEQMRSGREADQSSDLYALGCILYELTTGVQAFRGTLSTVRREAKRGAFVLPTRARPDLPPYVSEAIMTLLQPLPADRYSSVEALMAALFQQQVPPIVQVENLEELASLPWSVSSVSTVGAALVRSLRPGHEEDHEAAAERALLRRQLEQLALLFGALFVLLGGLLAGLAVLWLI